MKEKNHEKPNPQLEALLDYLKRSRGFDFTAYKRSTLQRRVEKRMQAVNITDMDEYLDHLEVHPDEFVALFDTILISVTEFFRDPPVWDMLSAEVIPEITRHKAPRDHIRVWSAGCATGEEAYSIAMLLSEALGIEQMRDRVKVYATDADESALDTARLGVYPAKMLQNVPPRLLEKYFVQDNDRYSFHREARRGVIFGRHDLIQDPPISRIDLVLCRNTLMYFNGESQSKILARFHLALNGGGYLVAGRAEMLLTHGHMFVPVDLKRRIFQKIAKDALIDRVATLVRANNRDDDDPERQILATAFENATTAQLMLDAEGRLVALNQSARQLLKLETKETGRPLRDLGPSMWPLHVQRVIEHAFADLVPAELKNLEWPDVTGRPRYYNVSITPLRRKTGAPAGMTVMFEDVTTFRNLYEQLQRSRQELETTNEELQSTVEELETTNEELQSTNEELETMNEELQSTNEQLHTTNDELQSRGEELNSVNAFLQSILSAMEHGLAVLDTQGHVTHWNARAERLWGLRAEEVRGKPFLSLDIGLPLDQLVHPIRKCLAGERCELTLTAVNRKGQPISVRVECTPMKPVGRAIEGAVILMDEPESRERSES